MSCWQCGEMLPPNAEFCPGCGAVKVRPLGEPVDATGDEKEIHDLLTQANLLRLRGDSKAASQKCIQTLRLSPGNASAHSLLGDICYAEGRLRDAMEWYRLALTLDPGRKSDREKLDKLIDNFYTSPAALASQEEPDEEPLIANQGAGRWRLRLPQLLYL
jgi:tetratricopeptide (TPR) repeat protein